MSERYEGFANTATYLAALYLRQDKGVYERVSSMLTRAPLRADTAAVIVAAVKIRKADVEDDMCCGVIGNVLHLDSWAEGNINWQEIADLFNSEMEIVAEPVSGEFQQLMAEAIVEGNVVRFERKFDRKTYQMLDEAMQAIGGKWNRKAQGHVFQDDPADQIEAIIETGTFEKPKKQDNFGFFPTPPSLAQELVTLAGLTAGMSVFEPSAGDGSIAMCAASVVGHGNVTTMELQESNTAKLREKGFDPIQGDFLAYNSAQRYQRVLMNPPFAKQADIDHVQHAWQFVSPGGRLVAIMAASVSFRDNAKTVSFRNFVEQHGGRIIENPDGSFKSSGTGVRTVTVVVDKPTIKEPANQEFNFWDVDEALCA